MRRRLQEALHSFHVRFKIARAFFPAADGAGNYCERGVGDIIRLGRRPGLLFLLVFRPESGAHICIQKQPFVLAGSSESHGLIDVTLHRFEIGSGK